MFSPLLCTHSKQLTRKVLVMTSDALETLLIRVQWEGMGDVGSVWYKPALLPPYPTIRVLSYRKSEIHPLHVLVDFQKFSTLRVKWGLFLEGGGGGGVLILEEKKNNLGFNLLKFVFCAMPVHQKCSPKFTFSSLLSLHVFCSLQ